MQQALDLRSPEELRDDGIYEVTLSHERWIPLAMPALIAARDKHPDGFTSDEVRAEAEALNVPTPKSMNAWGAVFVAASRAGLIRGTDRVRQSTRKEAQGHRNAIWRAA